MVLMVIGGPFCGPRAATARATSPYGLGVSGGHGVTTPRSQTTTTHTSSDRPQDAPPATAAAAADLRARREAAELTRQDLAQAADCSISYLADLERGLIPKRSKTLRRVLAALDDVESAGFP
jgi:hypothetical protein